ncbi:MAG: DUF6718 family protein [Sarcina sp.]
MLNSYTNLEERLLDKKFKIIASMVNLLIRLKKNEHILIDTEEEIKFEDKSNNKIYVKKPTIVITDKENNPVLVFDVAKDRSGIPYTTSNRLLYEKIGVKEYNIIFQNGDIIQYFLNDEKRYDMRICRNGDMFKSNVYEKLNIPVDDVIDGQSKKIKSVKEYSGMVYLIAKKFNESGSIALKTQIGDRMASLSKYLTIATLEKDIQIVTLNDPTAYNEYAPYEFVDSELEFITKVLKIY